MQTLIVWLIPLTLGLGTLALGLGLGVIAPPTPATPLPATPPCRRPLALAVVQRLNGMTMSFSFSGVEPGHATTET